MNELVLSTGEAVLFWVLAPLMVLGALALLFVKRPVHIAVSIAGVMVALAVLYVALEAPFLGAVQVVVYTGAVMMIFLFVIMLIGVDSRESLTETLAGQRWIAVLGGGGLLALVVAIVTRATFGAPVGLASANADTNPVGVARLIFGDYVFPFELTAALLITAALGALVLSHRRRLGPKTGQKETVERKLNALKASGGHVAVLSAPGPGVYARTNSADMPAMSASGETLDASITTVLRTRGQVIRDDEATTETGRVAMIASGAPVVDTTDDAHAQSRESSDGMVEETVSEETVPEETVPEETVPEETLPEDTLPDMPDRQAAENEGDER
ncbi:NADH-quinone oxidoreductase subunit J [Ruania halotolerans]|uniref:NADH-quinone oxidoreductase subunit J n=1 Tax=Ruania halotolerans TaxID=2897773 RepID=UPI001E43AB69|nr:NADH-quinone oxidoreductase subunit J [Ruania halotolerans]UFU05799.1 NADH-quinone oxidoreductase subunit J [Ruania halotolerans]